MLRIGCSLFLDIAVIVESLLSNKDFLGYQGEDWRLVRPDPVENCEVLSDLCGNKLACHRFMATGRGHTTPGSETKGSSLVRAMAVTRVSAFVLVQSLCPEGEEKGA